MLFSATMPPEISAIAASLLTNPVRVAVTPVASTVEAVEQLVYFVDKENKRSLLLEVLKDKSVVSALVFTRTKHGADRVVRELVSHKINALAIHGNKSQNARQSALNSFKNRETRVLVATDIAARGIDIEELSHVINFDLPEVPETYVHRIGRTGRAGLGGTAISFCDFDEKPLLAAIEKLIGKRVTEVKEHPYPLLNTTPTPKSPPPARRPREASAAQRRKPPETARVARQDVINAEIKQTQQQSRNPKAAPRNKNGSSGSRYRCSHPRGPRNG